MLNFFFRTATGLVGFAQRQLDRVVPPQTRQSKYKQATDFVAARPLLATFLLTQLTFSLIPLLFFLSFAFSVILLAASAALLFALFWVGLALLVLVPTLCLTGSVAFCAWAWAAACFLVARSTFVQLQSLLPPAGPQPHREQKQLDGGGTPPGPASAPFPPASPSITGSWAKVSHSDESPQQAGEGEGDNTTDSNGGSPTRETP